MGHILGGLVIVVGVLSFAGYFISKDLEDGEVTPPKKETIVSHLFQDGSVLKKTFEGKWECDGDGDDVWITSSERAQRYISFLNESSFIKMPDGSYVNTNTITKVTTETKDVQPAMSN